MRIFNALKVKLLLPLLAISLVCGPALFAASTAKQLEKGKKLYAEQKDDEAMDYFIDVLVNGTRQEVEEANQYINLIHSRIGGIQNPVEVDINFKEGEERRLQPGQDPAVLEAQLAAETAQLEDAVLEEGLVADKNHLGDVDAETQALLRQAQGEVEEVENLTEEELARQEELLTAKAQNAALQAQEVGTLVEEEAKKASSTFKDLTSPAALQARQIYTSQKVASMKAAVTARLEKAEGVRIYFRNDLPDAIDIDSDVLFNGYKFRPEAMSLLDDVYALMALTQGAGYVILPPGSYTDNITLAGIRQAMALNSYFVHKGLSSGKISYNMGLYDQEPPAKYANLDGVSIVFDFNADLPASMPDAASVNKMPMLSMAVVPVDNKIDPTAGEAFVIDFSVIETVDAIDNWLFQVIQHAGDEKYYVVRQLEGFAPVYHQLVWNGRKGIIGPELACGTYTLALTATDVQGGKRTIRRQIEVDCAAKQAIAEEAAKAQQAKEDKGLDYKTSRLWTRPGRVMKAAPVAAAEPEVVDPFAATAPVADPYAQPDYSAAYTEPAPGNVYTEPAAGAAAYTEPAAGAATYTEPAAQAYTEPAGQTYTEPTAQGVNNPYDMPYEQF